MFDMPVNILKFKIHNEVREREREVYFKGDIAIIKQKFTQFNNVVVNILILIFTFYFKF